MSRAAHQRALALAVIGGGVAAAWLILALSTDVGDANGYWIAAAMVPCLAVAVLLVDRLPGAAITRVVTAFVLCVLLALLVGDLVAWQDPTSGPLAWAALLPFWAGTLPMLPVMAVVFPDGVAERGPWRWVFVAQMVGLVLMLPSLVDQQREPVWLPALAVGIAGLVVIFVTGLVRAVALVVLWARASGERRRQLSAFVAVAAVIAAMYAVGGIAKLLAGGPGSEGDFSAPVLALLLAALPCALGLSMLRHRLFGIEMAVHRVAVGSLLSILLFGVYAATAAVIGEIAGTSERIDIAALVAAAAVAAALGPLHRIASAGIDRFMFGDRDRPDSALRSLGARLGDAVDPLEVPSVVVTSVAAALRLPFVALDRPDGAGGVIRTSHGVEPTDREVVAFPIQVGEESLGELITVPRAGQDQLSEADLQLLRDLARQAGPALQAGSLALQLADSRERLRRDRLEERAHLRRSLHDGVSPSFAGIAMTAATAQARTTDPEALRLLARIEAEARAGTDTMRALLDGLRPPGLAEAGLAGALESRASELTDATGADFAVELGEMVGLDPEVERTAYLIAVEAMVNAARHARASRCRVSLGADAGQLVVVVADDGVGRSGAAEGDGLSSARERLAELGGELRVEDAVGGGTRIEARLPQWRASA